MTDASGHDETDEPIRDTQPTRAPRYSVMLSAIVERFGGAGATRHRVRDLSTSGVRIDQATDMPVGATVLVSVGILEAVGATVAWVKDGEAGLRFAHAIDLDDARSKAAIAPRKTGAPARDATAAGPTAGWIGDLNSPYRK